MSRASGQWWARWRDSGRPWSPVLVREWTARDHVFVVGHRVVEWQGIEGVTRADDPDIEWGKPIPQPGEKPWTRARKNELLVALLTSKDRPVELHARLVEQYANHADDCDCDWCHRLTKTEVDAIAERLKNAEAAP